MMTLPYIVTSVLKSQWYQLAIFLFCVVFVHVTSKDNKSKAVSFKIF